MGWYRAIVGREGESMAADNRYLHPSRVNHKRPKWLEELSDSKAEAAIRKEAERIRNGHEPPPTLEEVQDIWARALGDRTTADLLDEIRGKPFPDRSPQSSE